MENTTDTTPPQTAAAPGSALLQSWTLDELTSDEFIILVEEIWLEHGLDLWRQAHEFWLGKSGGSAARLTGSRTVEDVRCSAQNAAILKAALADNERLRSALSRIEINYRDSTTKIPAHLHAYCMRSEAKVALGRQDADAWHLELQDLLKQNIKTEERR